MNEADFDAVIAVHLKGSFNVSRAAAPHFKAQASGSYVHMTFVPEALRLIAQSGSTWFPGIAGLLLPMQQVVFGLLIIGFLIFEPHGLAAVWARVRRTFHLWPFRT